MKSFKVQLEKDRVENEYWRRSDELCLGWFRGRIGKSEFGGKGILKQREKHMQTRRH